MCCSKLKVCSVSTFDLLLSINTHTHNELTNLLRLPQSYTVFKNNKKNIATNDLVFDKIDIFQTIDPWLSLNQKWISMLS